MRESALRYIQNNLVWLTAGVALRQMSASSCMSRYSYYDMEEVEEYFKGNTLADQPSIMNGIAYRLITLFCTRFKASTVVYAITMLSDFICGYLLDNSAYFFVSSVLPSDLVSAVCLVFVFYHKNLFRRFIGLFLLLVCLESTHYRCEPGINVYWYINMQMFDEYKTLFNELFQTTHYFLLTMSTLSKLASTKIYLIMTFKDMGYRGYLLVWCIMEKECNKSKLFNLCRGLATVGAAIDSIVWYMLVYGGVGNMNFLCWSNVITIVATGLAVLAQEYKEQRHLEKAEKMRIESSNEECKKKDNHLLKRD
ncbi:hypothetical protein NEMIN01_0912 [Nematocida minor]|uniref:uncharacterized protein n=1 Tax=Nematocida minor TaxID=1912983 RepID=UPI00221E5A90|nr:uncharacterized protein NEMIN01_0912 [Nematocida minor]KAI5190213.1 hypothetical protein NEMIN01_0912 [Nematocida minor]